jgi:hypothetical protein
MQLWACAVGEAHNYWRSYWEYLPDTDECLCGLKLRIKQSVVYYVLS